MSVKDIYVPLFNVNLLLISSIDQEEKDKIHMAINYHDYVRKAWVNYKKSSISDDYKPVDIQYEAMTLYLNTLCSKYSSEIKRLSFTFLSDIINWFHSKKILFTVHDCHEYEIVSISDEQLQDLNIFVEFKYGNNMKFLLLS